MILIPLLDYYEILDKPLVTMNKNITFKNSMKKKSFHLKIMMSLRYRIYLNKCYLIFIYLNNKKVMT